MSNKDEGVEDSKIYQFDFSTDEKKFNQLQKDLQAIYSYQCKNKLRNFIFIFSVTILSAAMVYLGFSIQQVVHEDTSLFAVGIAIILFVPVNWMLNRSYMQSYKQLVVNQNKKYFGENKNIKISNKSICCSSPGKVIDINWSRIDDLYSTDNFYLFVSGSLYLDIPQSIFNREALDSTEMISFIESLSGKTTIHLR